LCAHILVLSDDFHGYKPPITFENCFVSLKLKNNASSGSGDGSSNKTSTTSTSSGGEASLCYNNTTRNNFRQTNGDLEAYKNSFRIYLNADSGCGVQPSNNDLKNLYTLNTINNNSNNLIRKLYETTVKSTLASNNRASQHMSTLVNAAVAQHQANNLMTLRNSLQIANDMFSSFGYNEKLQNKLEKYLEHVCLKSNSFSNTNFSYVDYSKR
jgi:hypothetical protein